MIPIEAYRIGWWTHRWWSPRSIWVGLVRGSQPADGQKVQRSRYVQVIRRNLRLLRRPHRPWQAECEYCVWCPRAFTRDGAVRKARRWYMTHYDIRRHERRYGPRPQLHARRDDAIAKGIRP